MLWVTVEPGAVIGLCRSVSLVGVPPVSISGATSRK